MRYICNECESKFETRQDAVNHLISEHFETVAELIAAYFIVEEADSDA